MSNVRRRKAKQRKPATEVAIPGVRAYLRAEFLRTGVDPRAADGRLGELEQRAIDALDRGESIEVDAWEVVEDPREAVALFGGEYSRVEVGPDDTVTVVEPADGPLDLPGGGS